MNVWPALAAGFGMTALLFLFAWLLAEKLMNYSLVDAVWASCIGLTAVFWLGVVGELGLKQLVAAGLIAVWSVRLGGHLQRRIRRAHPDEDARYVKLREVWAGRVTSAFFWFFQAQGISVILLALPFLLIAMDPDGAWSAWESAGLAVVLIGILGETVADSQMSAFKAMNPDSKAVCQDGLWRYSRHPNYFFEAVIWTGFYIYACGSEWGWAMIHAPAIIIFLLLKVTGIPPTEAAAVLRKGDAYRRYQKSTSPFIPWPPREIP
jgi:steroid 5-alpha reductase family enzyme